MSSRFEVANTERYSWVLLPLDPWRAPCALACYECGAWVWDEGIHDLFHARDGRSLAAKFYPDTDEDPIVMVSDE